MLLSRRYSEADTAWLVAEAQSRGLSSYGRGEPTKGRTAGQLRRSDAAWERGAADKPWKKFDREALKKLAAQLGVQQGDQQ